jgi:hypothetical protein
MLPDSTARTVRARNSGPGRTDCPAAAPFPNGAAPAGGLTNPAPAAGQLPFPAFAAAFSCFLNARTSASEASSTMSATE